MSIIQQEIARRRTFAIISHPDAGKTTVTEQLLLAGGAIQMAGTIKARKSARHATSDWMTMEKERGISITSSVMQFTQDGIIINLLDTPGHADFSEDTYRTLTAVDSALMVIDAAKGVEERTRKLMDVCRLRTTPIVSFINKLDREGLSPLDLFDEIERELAIVCVPITWPIGMGSGLRGLYHLLEDRTYVYRKASTVRSPGVLNGLHSDATRAFLGADFNDVCEEIALIRAACLNFSREAYLEGRQTPVFFGSALHNFGVRSFLEFIVRHAPPPQPRMAAQRQIRPDEEKFTGFTFKIQANMDPAHRDRIAFVRICSGRFERGMKLHLVRTQRDMPISNALTFMAGNREHTDLAWPGDIIGLHSHGTIKVGDTFTQGEQLTFTGIPHFAPELFRRVRLVDPLKSKALLKGLVQLGEEGAVQVFRPLHRNELLVGAVGILQFEVVAWRLREEYGVDCVYEQVPIVAARWVSSVDHKRLEDFSNRAVDNLALDGAENLAYLAPSMINLNLIMERWPGIEFHKTREH